MLFEEFMMSYRHGMLTDMAYTDPIQPGQTAADVIVRWGERGRIAEPAIKPRIKLVLQRVAPWIDATAVDRLPAPVMMTPGVSWADNLAISPAGTGAAPSALRAGAGAGDSQRPVKDDLAGARRPH